MDDETCQKCRAAMRRAFIKPLDPGARAICEKFHKLANGLDFFSLCIFSQPTAAVVEGEFRMASGEQSAAADAA